MFRIIWVRSFRKKIEELEKKNVDWVLEGINFFKINDVETLRYVNGIGDGYKAACEDILEWIEKKEKKRN